MFRLPSRRSSRHFARSVGNNNRRPLLLRSTDSGHTWTDVSFSLHTATRAAAADERGREALLKYILRPPLATERLLPGPDGLVRIALKKPFSDGTVAVDLDHLSLLCRLVALVPTTPSVTDEGQDHEQPSGTTSNGVSTAIDAEAGSRAS